MKNLILIIVLIIAFTGCKKKDDNNSNLGALDIPVATEASHIHADKFTANWEASADAIDYQIDVATDRYFSNIFVSKENLTGPVIVDGLSASIRYFYRVRAVNGSRVSDNSNTIDVFTPPEPPKVKAATQITSNSFTANWNWSPMVSTYILYISTAPLPGNEQSILPNYNGIEVTQNLHSVTGLSSHTNYYYALKAKNGNAISDLSNMIACTTK